MDIRQTTQAWTLLFIVKDLKPPYALDESDLSLFQVESFLSAKGNDFTFPTLLPYPWLVKFSGAESRLFYVCRQRASLQLSADNTSGLHLLRDRCLILLADTGVILAFKTAFDTCDYEKIYNWFIFMRI